jgi:hypothetical protein
METAIIIVIIAVDGFQLQLLLDHSCTSWLVTLGHGLRLRICVHAHAPFLSHKAPRTICVARLRGTVQQFHQRQLIKGVVEVFPPSSNAYMNNSYSI